jgi:hypothetical protein
MTSKKLPGKLAAGVRKLKEPAAPPSAKPRARRDSAGQPAPHQVKSTSTRSDSRADLHPARVWPD